MVKGQCKRTVQKAATFSLYWQSSRSLLNFLKYHALSVLFSQKADRYPASILCIPSICMRTLSLTGFDVLTYNDWEDNFFSLSIWLCPSPPVVISAEGGLLSPTMLSLSVSLSPHAHLIPAHWKKCVCVCVYVFMLLRYFLCLLRSVYFRSLPELRFFLPNICHPIHPSFLFPPSLSLSLQAHKKKKKKKNPYHWLLWDPVAMQQRGFHMVLACVCACLL